MANSTKEKLKRWRKSKGLSQDAMAELVECSQQAYSNVETGRRPPWLALALNIERVTKGVVAAHLWPAAQKRRAA